MPIVAIASVGDSAGATVTAFALTLTWPRPALLAECSADGGQLLRGYFQCVEPPARGLWNLAVAAVQGAESAASSIDEQLIALSDSDHHFLLAGLADPFLATQISGDTWSVITHVLDDLPYVVLADVGRIGPAAPFRLVEAADLVLVVVRPSLAQLAAARPRLERLRQALNQRTPLALCIVGDGPYPPGQVSDELGDFLLTLRLPYDPKAAGILSAGGGSERARSRIGASPLLQAANRVARSLDQYVGEPSPGQTALHVGGTE